MTSPYEIEGEMFDALCTKLQELVTNGTLVDLIIGFDELIPDDFPVAYVEIADERFEAVTPNKDQYVMEVDVTVEHFDEEYRIGQQKIRQIAMKVYEQLTSDRQLGGDVDICNVESFETEVEMLPDGFLFHKTLTVTLTRWLFG